MRTVNRAVLVMARVNSLVLEVLEVRIGVLVALTITACGPEPERCAAARQVEPTLRLGTGFADFTPIHDGDALDIDFGEQGGWHVWMAFRTTGMVVGHRGGLGPPDPEGPTFTCGLKDEEGVEVASAVHDRFPIDGDVSQGELLGVQMRLSDAVNEAISNGGANPAAGALTLEADVVDTCGTEATGSHGVTLDVASSKRRRRATSPR